MRAREFSGFSHRLNDACFVVRHLQRHHGGGPNSALQDMFGNFFDPDDAIGAGRNRHDLGCRGSRLSEHRVVLDAACQNRCPGLRHHPGVGL